MSYIPAVILLMIIYMASLVGFITPHQQAWYLFYTPFFILLNAILLGIYHKNWNKTTLQYILWSATIGFLVELLAVQTGFTYGDYQFGDTLGFSLLGVPLIMAVYWLVLAYSTACLSAKLPVNNSALKIGTGALLMAGLTGLIQQVATPLDFWSLQGNGSFFRLIGIVFLVGLGLQYLFIRLKVNSKNPIALYVYGGLALFFTGLISFL
ncbi:carotenoid biosynthesis protein [Aureispira anguillae]|uniref:Carotenoid biosynthesis protein n=1 Tax=Aureispira anguillae TaxID=2864201 RepID=A0A915YC32_9BACT|nr:carotenoid biosynthesis protein [Aureispira anguillae]BDS10343.1 carotenoid biosynthesis protein [Aureispira anguillae]